jgi:hypothetical protein
MGHGPALLDRIDVQFVFSLDRGRTKVHRIRTFTDEGISLEGNRANEGSTVVHSLASLGSHRLCAGSRSIPHSCLARLGRTHEAR